MIHREREGESFPVPCLRFPNLPWGGLICGEFRFWKVVYFFQCFLRSVVDRGGLAVLFCINDIETQSQL